MKYDMPRRERGYYGITENHVPVATLFLDEETVDRLQDPPSLRVFIQLPDNLPPPGGCGDAECLCRVEPGLCE